MKFKIIKKEVHNVEAKKKQKRLTQRDLKEEKLKILLQQKQTPTIKEEINDLERSIQRSKLGKRSKSKGGNYERVIAEKFKTFFGVELRRTPQSGGFAKDNKKAEAFRGDIIPVEKDVDLLLHIECKSCKKWTLPQWIDQAQGDCPKDKVPTVIFHKYNSNKDFVTLSIEDFFRLVSKDKIISIRKRGKSE